MSIMPIITFKAGICDLDTASQPPKVKPRATPGYIYLYAEDDLIHFCWRPRSASMSAPELDLVMVPTDGQFRPYDRASQETSSDQPRAPTNGRIFVLKFSSSSQRYLFWMQSRSQSSSGDPSFFSARDLKLGAIVDQLLQGEEVDVPAAMAQAQPSGDGAGDDDDAMEGVEGTGHNQAHPEGGSGTAGSGGATETPRQGDGSGGAGAGSGRANFGSTTDASALVHNFLNSLKGGSGAGNAHQIPDKLFATLPDLLPPSTTVPVISSLDAATIDQLLSFLPPSLLLLAQEADDLSSVDPTPDTTQAAIQALGMEQKKEILKQVLHSPQFSQSLGSLTVALRDGGLPSIGDALGIKVRNGGFIEGGQMPLGGGEAVEAFLEGVKASIEEEDRTGRDRMDTDG